MGSYQPLFHLTVQHLFFDEALCPNLEFMPTPASQSLLQRTGLLTRNTANGIGVFYNDAQIEALQHYVNDPDEPFSFQYKVFSKDPRFRNYTEAPAYKDGAMLYFDTRKARAEGDEAFCLHEAAYVSEADFEAITAPALVDVLDKKDQLVKPAFAVRVEVLQKDLEGAARHYVIKFDARKTYWKYYLLGNLTEKEAYISDLNHETEFESGGTTVLPGRRTALIFRSKTAIPLRENLQLRFQLKEKRAGNGRVIIKRLPHASANQINTEKIDGNESVISEIYVNC